MPPAPSLDEQRYYYRGVGGRLLARTSTFDFGPAMSFNERLIGAIRFTNIGEHPIVRLWSDDLVRCLQEALGETPWERLYPIRTEVMWPYIDDALTEKRKCVVVIVEVADDGAVETNEAAAAAWKCRTILEVFRIAEVEVEIRAINRSRYAMDVGLESRLENHIDEEDWVERIFPFTSTTGLTYDTFHPVLSHIGYEISPEYESTTRYGTMGAHLRLTQRPAEAYGLTCRHVAHRPAADFRSDMKAYWIADKEKYLAANDSPKHRILQMCRSSLEQLQVEVKTSLETADKSLQRLKLASTKYISDPASFPEPTQHSQSLQAELENALPDLRTINAMISDQRMEEADTRAIGYVAVMPPLEVSSKGFYRDWALVRLDQAKFGDGGDTSITNKVFVNAKNFYDLNVAAHRHEKLREMVSFIEDSRDAKGFIRLRGSPQTALPDYQRKSVGVGKRGAASKLTFGVTNEVKAVVRVNHGKRLTAWEWIVISCDPSIPFSKGGDSGSAIFDSNGFVVALLTGGVEDGSTARRLWKKQSTGGNLPDDPGKDEDLQKQGPADYQEYAANTDLTFATPIDVVLEDIKLMTKSKVEIM